MVGNGDDTGRSIIYYEYPAALRGRAFERNMRYNEPNPKTFKSHEVATSKRLSRSWLLLASYSATKRHEPPIGAVNPNSDIFGEINVWEWGGAKFSAAYIFPYDINVAANVDHRSGDPLARTVLLTGGSTIPSITVPVEPIGTRRFPSAADAECGCGRKHDSPASDA